MGENGRPARRYAKPVAVPERLDLLRGPVSGVVELPRRLDWSGHARYDLDSAGRIVDLYRTVIADAVDSADLHTYLNELVLKRLWARIWLATEVRRVWEERFPELAVLRSEPKAA